MRGKIHHVAYLMMRSFRNPLFTTLSSIFLRLDRESDSSDFLDPMFVCLIDLFVKERWRRGACPITEETKIRRMNDVFPGCFFWLQNSGHRTIERVMQMKYY
jgi:hypothetical protein